MSSPFGLPTNYLTNPMYLYYMQMMMQQALQQQQAQQQSIMARQQALAEQNAQIEAQRQAELAALQSQQAATAQQQAVENVPAQTAVQSTGDGKDDGKISGRKKVKNFFKGIGNFFKGMVCDENGKFSLKRTLTTVAVAAGAVALTVATGGAATPFLVAAGATMGGIQVVKGGIKAANAKTDAEAEQAWQSIGSGTAAVITSVAGAKGALKAAGKPIPKGNAVTSSLRATKDCFHIAYKGSTAAAKGILHPMKSARAIKNYWNNTAKPNMENAFSYKNGHKNHTKFVEEKINNNIKDIDAKLKVLNDELAAKNLTGKRINEIKAQIGELTHKRNIESNKLRYNDYKNKQLEAFEKQIKDIEAKLADKSTPKAVKEKLTKTQEDLYKDYINTDNHIEVHIEKSIKNKEDFISQLKKQYKNAPKEGKNSIQKEIELNQNILKAMKEQKKIEVAQHNIERANIDITKLQKELKKNNITEARKEILTSRIAKIEKAIAKDKKILRNSNYSVAAQQHLPKVGLAYGSYYLADREVQTAINQADAYAQMNGFANAAQMQAYMNAMQQSQNTLNAADQFIASGSTTNPYATGNSYQMLTQMQAPAGNNLGFNELYSSPYTEMI